MRERGSARYFIQTTAVLSLLIPTEVFHHFFSSFLWALTTLTIFLMLS